MPVKPPADAERAELRASLEAAAARLRAELAATLHAGGTRAAPGLPDRREETDDQALADLQDTLDIASAERDSRELQDVLAALARIDAPGFGQCSECGEAIGMPRLRAQPQAQRCVRCAAEAERRGAAPPPPAL